MITSAIKLDEKSYLVNECVKITMNVDDKENFLTVDFNDEFITEQEANEIVDEFFLRAFENSENEDSQEQRD